MKRTTGSNQNQIRMTDAFKARIRKYQDKMLRETGLEINFSEAVRALIDRSLKEARL